MNLYRNRRLTLDCMAFRDFGKTVSYSLKKKICVRCGDKVKLKSMSSYNKDVYRNIAFCLDCQNWLKKDKNT